METKYYLELFPGRYAALAQEVAAAEPKLSAVVEPSRDLMGGFHAHVLGYEQSLAMGPWFAAPGDPVYGHLKWILDRGLVLWALRTALVEVSGEQALRREASIEITGADEGRIAFCLHFTGREQRGSFTGERFRYTAG